MVKVKSLPAIQGNASYVKFDIFGHLCKVTCRDDSDICVQPSGNYTNVVAELAFFWISLQQVTCIP